MATKTMTQLTEVTSLDPTDIIWAETSAGPRQITRNNFMPLRADFSLITDDDIDLSTSRLWVMQASDGRVREISVQDLVFGNYRNRAETADFTLTPGIHNVRAVQLGEDLPDAVETVTLDGTVPGIEGCDFYLVNFRTESISVVPSDITLHVDGVSGTGIIRAKHAATITVSNGGAQAVFSGG